MNCDWVRETLEHHDPATELSDAIVEHIDACPACRSVLDARFPPAVTPVRRDAPAASPRVWIGPPAVMAIAVAAMAMLSVRSQPPPSPYDTRIAMLDYSEICVVVWEPPECEVP